MDLPIEKVKDLYYKEGLSAREVGEKIGASVWQVIKFMKKNNLPRRDQSETHRLAFLSAPPSFKPKRTLTTQEEQLKIAGLMLYWGEGAKTTDSTVDLANSDPLMIKLFLRMLREIYGVKEERLRILLYCYANQDVKELINYWVGIARIPQKQFSKPYIRQDFLEGKKNKMPYGLIHVRYSDKKLVATIKNDIEKLLKIFIG
ncbi:MAG: hypothetical protein ACOZBZ_04860 [Patescibacteria group bacterium]